MRLDGELIQFYDRKNLGEPVELPIHNKEERKSKYEKALEELKENIEKERSLTMSMPRFIGMIRVVPVAKVQEAMKSDPEIERIGMEVAMADEKGQGREPQDVSAENLGFDIRSSGLEQKTRYIEVKARSYLGPVALTPNEWFKAKRFGDDYYLYAVMNAATNPELYIISNPAQNLAAEERIEVVRYLVPFKELETKGTLAPL